MPAELLETFERKRDQGRDPYLVYRRDRGWQVAAERGMGDRRCGSSGGPPVRAGNGDGAGAPTRTWACTCSSRSTRPACRHASGCMAGTISVARSV